jgi:drug/metabolite transporter (DMT)-like permease
MPGRGRDRSAAAGELVPALTSRPLAHWVLLLALVAMWGSSFMFTSVAVSTLPPATVVAARLLIAALGLGGALVFRGRRLPASPGHRRFFVICAVVGNVLPFWLISWGQQHIPSGLAGLLMAIMPLTTLVLAHLFVENERLSGIRVLGFAIGFSGIVVLVGPNVLLELRGVGSALLAELAVLGGAVCYAANAIISQRRPPAAPLEAAAGVAIAASLLMVPLAAAADQPWQLSLTAPAAVAVAFLGIVSTGIATLVYFRLISLAGPSFLSLINYLIPIWAMALGVVALGEQPDWSALVALVLVLSGIALSEMSMAGSASRTRRPTDSA